jgi:aminoglycoside 6'-N-acetyltransferase I
MHRIRTARASDRDELAQLAASLWPEATAAEHGVDIAEVLAMGSNGTLPMTILVSEDEKGTLSGFIEVGLRSHADGCDPKRPVGFVEGWFVVEPVRNRGVGRELLRAAEDWARAQGCTEMGSDALVDNELSLRAHEAMGFEVVDRCVHFKKAL